MNKTKILISVIVISLAGVSGYVYSVHIGESKAKIDRSEKNDHKHHTVFHCPMHPQITSEKPGQTCPLCGMDLVPLDQEDLNNKKEALTSEVSGHVGVQLSEQMQERIGIKIETVEKRNLFSIISAPGRIAFDPELYTAQGEYLEAIKQWHRVKGSPLDGVRNGAKEMMKSSEIRLKVLGLSDSQIADLGRKGYQSEGLLVAGKGQDAWIYADVFETDLPFIQKGQSVKVTASFLQGESLAGFVTSVDQVIDAKTRSAKVRIQLKKSHALLRPQSFVDVEIFSPRGEHLSVSREAVMDTGKNIFIFKKEGAGNFIPIPVVVTVKTAHYMALSGDIQEGDQIVSGGNFMMDSESRLKSVLSGTTPPSERTK